MAIDVFFRNNRLNIVVGHDEEKDVDLFYGSDNNDNNDAYTGEILHGTFEGRPFFYKHTIKLRIELVGYGDDVVGMVCSILASCSALHDVRMCVLNLDSDRERVAFFNAVVDTINAVMAKTGRHIILAKETTEQYAAEMAARSEIQAEYERLEEEQGRALREWMQSGDGESFEEYMNDPSYEVYRGAD